MENGSSLRKLVPALELQLEALKRENEALAQQVKRLIRAEGKLYDYQQELDAQLKEYKGLYELSTRLGSSFDIQALFKQTVEYVIQQLEFERAVFLRRAENTAYRACAFDGYYAPSDKERISRLSIEADAPCLVPLITGKERLTCTAGNRNPELVNCRPKLQMNEFFIYPLGHNDIPHALLAVGNSAENAAFYRKVEETPGALLSMGNLVGLVSSLLDNHLFFERLVQARQQESAAEAKYRDIFENASEGIFQRTPDGRYLNANPALAHMLGHASPKELMTGVTDIGREMYRDPARHAELMRLLAANGKVEGFEAQMYRKDRSCIWVSLSARVVRDNAGNVLFYEGMLEEITKRKMAESALKESEQNYRQLSEALERRVRETVDELRQKDKMLILQGRQAVMGEMLSNIAHQWRQPLNMLALLVQDLQLTHKRSGLSEGYIDQAVRRTMETVQQMSRTIDDFRYFFKPDKEKLEFRIREPLEKSLALLEGSFRIHGIRTEVDQAGDPVITGFLGEFVQVLLNILINARDALVASRTEKPLIRIRLFNEGGKTVVTVADNAGGIPEQIRDKIFEPYFTTKGPEQGTGIGLFMCKTIIEKSMNGKLTAQNTGGGAEFRIEV